MAEIKETSIPDVLEILPRVFKDPRGSFFESFRENWFTSRGLDIKWVQDNQSSSVKGTIRGLHFQRPPFAQDKLVRVIKGRVLDVAVDLRKGSKTFGQAVCVELSEEKNNLLLVPAGFAHGFSVLEDATFAYKCSNYYNKESEGGIIWDDSDLGIDWMVDNPIVSEKDAILPTLKQFIDREGGL
ncbi:dTDP-4-dehydrorhamnose 3,5-epimerase [Algoriphagus sediminis]|uniref:dTDP-4-dehydrorhamnose 3,5-epimerase n=1 Tax=Algoriphagus sediminis TaxID=3057113 RepID=A0ABT7YBH4_9BACT|nr:dTDP-4-dehydrorhamnose 3,5-epimerase [Algoriphagus sediminis]MDN3203867.1 dTDP-4-dehydrorhamnose 3,5-epimerase [Algoriphagus sediminis]